MATTDQPTRWATVEIRSIRTTRSSQSTPVSQIRSIGASPGPTGIHSTRRNTTLQQRRSSELKANRSVSLNALFRNDSRRSLGSVAGGRCAFAHGARRRSNPGKSASSENKLLMNWHEASHVIANSHLDLGFGRLGISRLLDQDFPDGVLLMA